MKKPVEKKKSPRQKAREYAVQALYQWQLAQVSQDKLLEEFLSSHDFKKADKAYWRELVCKSMDETPALREAMKPYLTLELENITPVELAILTVAFYEFIHRPEIPFRVVINEAIDLSKCFGAADSHRFINGVLDAAAKKLRAVEVGMMRKK